MSLLEFANKMQKSKPCCNIPPKKPGHRIEVSRAQSLQLVMGTLRSKMDYYWQGSQAFQYLGWEANHPVNLLLWRRNNVCQPFTVRPRKGKKARPPCAYDSGALAL